MTMVLCGSCVLFSFRTLPASDSCPALTPNPASIWSLTRASVLASFSHGLPLKCFAIPAPLCMPHLMLLGCWRGPAQRAGGAQRKPVLGWDCRISIPVTLHRAKNIVIPFPFCQYHNVKREREMGDGVVTFYRQENFDVKQRILMFYQKCLIFNKSMCYKV